MILQTTLCFAAAAAVINIWLMMRIGQLRRSLQVSVGDGGQDAIIRRMRAQANFIENVPITLILVGLVEMAGKGGNWLAPLGAVFLLGRVAHGFGMDGAGFEPDRRIGAVMSISTQLVLAAVAILIAIGRV